MKKKILIISLLLLLITLLVISDTYALFETNASGVEDFDIGKWVIEVNGDDINTNQQIDLDDFTLSQTTHTADGYFAPGRTATYEIEIDASESDVSVEYELTVDDTVLLDHPNISLSFTNLNTNTVINSNTCSGVISLTDNSRVVTLELTITWNDVTQYDENDSALIGEDLEFTIDGNFKQYLGNNS